MFIQLIKNGYINYTAFCGIIFTVHYQSIKI